MGKVMSSPRPRTEHRPAARPALFGVAVLAAVAVAAPAAAQAPQCAAREAMLDRLAADYDEKPVSVGVTATGSLLEVLASPKGSWTIIVTVPDGPTCLVSSGDGWRAAPVQVAEEPAV
jgi:hypothetical protein